MRILFTCVLFLAVLNSWSGSKTHVYLFPGLGSDERIFEKITLDSNYVLINIAYPLPVRRSTMKQYAQMILPQIDTSTNYIFIGVSIGGMICVELADLLRPQKVIIISSAKCRQELPFRYRFQKTIPLNKITPKGIIKLGAMILQPLVEPDRNKNKNTFKSMLKKKDKTYLKRSVNMIINWKRKEYNKTIIHIHGTKDHTLPIRKIKATHIISKGSHMMALTRGEKLNTLILSLLVQ